MMLTFDDVPRSYRDAQYTRLGSANIHQIPVNCPFMAKFVSPDNFMGTMRVDVSRHVVR